MLLSLKKFSEQSIYEKGFDLNSLKQIKNEVINQSYFKFKNLKEIVISKNPYIFKSKKFLELKGFKPIFKEIPKHELYRINGFMKPYKKDEQYAFMIWVKKGKLYPWIDEISSELSILFHELGHVNDMENNLNFLKKDLSVNDLSLRELAAYIYTCEQLMKYGLKRTLGNHLFDLFYKGKEENKKSPHSIAANIFFKEYSFKPFLDFAEITLE